MLRQQRTQEKLFGLQLLQTYIPELSNSDGSDEDLELVATLLAHEDPEEEREGEGEEHSVGGVGMTVVLMLAVFLLMRMVGMVGVIFMQKN